MHPSSKTATTPFAARITGTGSAFPAKVLTNDDIARMVDTNDAWIRERTGICERRVSAPGNADETNSSLAARAALKALEMAGARPDEIDGILLGTCSPDTAVPATACWVQKKIGATNAFAVDLNAACSGFLYGLTLANSLIATGQAKKLLVIGSEVLSTLVNWQDRTSCILFGDGAGAAVVERTHSSDESRIHSSHLSADGRLWDLLITPGGGSAMPLDAEKAAAGLGKIHMKGTEVFKVAVKTLSDFGIKALEANGLSRDDVAWFLPHQANLRIIEAVARRLDFPMEKVLVNVDRYGNTSSATVPTMLDEAVRDGRIKKGDWILMDVFGAGLTNGSLMLRW